MKCGNCGKNVPYGLNCKCRDFGRDRNSDRNQQDNMGVELCSYYHGTRRCPMHSTIQIEGKWLCSTHFKLGRNSENEDAAIAFLNRALSDPRGVSKSLMTVHWAEEMMIKHPLGQRPDWWGDRPFPLPKYSDINPMRPRTPKDEERVRRIALEFDK